MPTLRNIQGASLVPDVGPALGQVQQIMENRRAQQQQDVLNQAIGAVLGVPGAVPGGAATTGGERYPWDERPTGEGQWWNENPADMQAREAAMVRIAQINPQAAKVVGGILASRDARAQEQLQRESDDAVRVSSLLLGIDDPAERMQALSNVVRERQAAGQDVSKLVELSQLSPADQNLRLRQNVVMGTDVKKLADMALKPDTPVRTWTTEDGGVIGQYRDGSVRPVALPEGVRVGSSAPRVEVNLPGQREGLTEEQKALAKSRVSRYDEVREAAVAAEDQNERLTQLEALDVQTGALEPLKVGTARVITALGGDGDELLNTDVATAEAFNSLAGKLVLDTMATQKGPQTDRDQERIAKTLPSLTNDALSREFITNSLKALNARRVEQFEFWDNWLNEQGGSLQGVEGAWRAYKRRNPMVSDFVKDAETGLPMFYNDFRAQARERNPNATDEQVRQAWQKLNNR